MTDFLADLAAFSEKALNLALPVAQDVEVPAPVMMATPQNPKALPAMVETPEAKDARDRSTIEKALTDSKSMARFNMSRQRENSLTKDNAILNDRKTMAPADFIMKHGTEMTAKLDAIDRGQAQLATVVDPNDRSGSQWLGDNLNNVVKGATNSVGGLATLATSAVNDKAAVAVAESMKQFNNAAEGLQSTSQQRRRYADNVRAELDDQDSLKQYEEEVGKDGKLLASLSMIGRDLIKGTNRLIEDPVMAETLIAEGVGSLLVGGPLTKGLKLAGSGISSLASKVGPSLTVAGERAATAASSALEKAAFPAVIGAMEAGGAFTDTVNQVMAVKHEDMLKTSTAYKSLIDKGMSEKDAKVEVAARAGNIASAITFPVAALSGSLVAKFEANPLKQVFSAPGKALGNSVNETIEEGIQSGTGQLAGNVGQQVMVDPETNLAKGVGAAVAQGGLAGFGTAGFIHAPGIAGSALATVGGKIADAAGGVADSVRARAETASPVAPERVAAEVNQAITTVPAVAEAVRSVVNDPAIAPENKSRVEVIAKQVETAFTIPAEEIAQMPPLMKETAEEQPGINRFQLMSQAAEFITKQDQTQEKRTEAAIWLLDQTTKHRETIQAGSEVLGDLKHDRPEFQAMSTFARVLDAASQTKGMHEALSWAKDKLAAPVVEEGTDLSTPEGAKLVKTTADIARLVPENINLKSAEGILRQDSLTPILTPEQRQDIHIAASLAKAMEAHSKALDIAFNKQDGIDAVNRAIEAGEAGTGSHKKSLRQHTAEITQAIKTGGVASAKPQMQQLAMFARSMRNKLEAMNTAIQNADGKDVPYQAMGPTGWLPKDGKQRVFYNPGDPKSAQLAETIHAETSAAITLANAFAQEYPQAGIKVIDIPSLVASKPKAGKDSSKPASKVTSQSQATTSEIDPNPNQIELPFPPSQPTQAPAPKQVPVAPVVETKVVKPAVEKPTPKAENTVSRITPEQASKLADSGLNDRISKLQDLAASKKATLEDRATLRILDEEMTQREDAYAAEDAGNRSPASDALPADEKSKDVGSGGAKTTAVVDATLADSFEEPIAEKTRKTKDVFPNLIQTKSENMFQSSIKLVAGASRLMVDTVKHPLVAAYKRLRESSKLFEMTGIKTNQKQISAFEALLKLANEAGLAMDERLAGAKDLLELLRDDTQANRFVRGRVLNIVEELDGKFSYDPKLQEAALLAGIDWLLSGQAVQSTLDSSSIADAMGIDQATPEMVAFFNRGLSVADAKQQLAQKIMSFWGAKPDRNADIAYSRGIPEAVAIEILAAFDKVGLIKHDVSDRFQNLTGKTYGRIFFDVREKALTEHFQNVGTARNLLSKMVLTNEEPSGVSIGVPIKGDNAIAKTQLRNNSVNTTEQQRQGIEHEQSVKYVPNLVVHDFMSALGEDNFVLLNGGRLSTKGMNVNHALSADGKTRALRTSFQNVLTQMSDVIAYANENNLDVSDVPSYYKHEITKVGRFHMVGASTPVADKYAREVFMPTRSILDLTTEKHQDFFWLTVAQGLGEKVEKQARAVSRQKAEASIAGQYAGVIQELKSWVVARNAGKQNALSKDLVQQILEASKGSISMHGVHSLLAVAEYQVAQESGSDLTAYTFHNYLEADGKTNGPINAMMLLATGAFTQEWIKTVGKGGVYFGDRKTLADHMKTDPNDIYTGTSSDLEVGVSGLLSNLAENSPAAAAQMGTMLRLMNALDIGVTFEDGKLSIGRNVSKNPLTITIYGSGLDGIAGNVADELVGYIYEKMSAYLAQKEAGSDAGIEDGVLYKGFWNDLQALTSKRGTQDKETRVYKVIEGFKPEKPVSKKALDAQGSPETFKLLPHEFKTLKANIGLFFIAPLHKAIENNVSQHLGDTTEKLRAATQAQSIVMRAMFRRAIIMKLAERQSDPSFRAGDFLSEQDLQGIIKDLMPFAPSFSTGSQSYYLSGSEQSDILGNKSADGTKSTVIEVEINGKKVSVSVPGSLARGLKDDFTTPARLSGVKLAGVKVTPTLVIGSGDGQMMLNAATNPKIQRALKVFDGMNMAADMIEDYSTMINESVHQTWTQGNPVRAVAKSFRDFVNKKPLDTVLDNNDTISQATGLMQDVLLEMTKNFSGNPKPKTEDIYDRVTINEMFNETADRLEFLADSIDARQEVFRRFPMSVDQMASGESPYVQPGSVVVAAGADILDLMNAEYDAQMAAKGHGEVAEPLPAGVKVVEAGDLAKELSSSLRSLDENQKSLLAASVKALSDTGYRMVSGTRSEVDAWLQQNNAERYRASHLNGANGFVDPVSKILVVVNGSAETVLHEMIHAATYQKVAAYYSDPKALSDVERLAIENIESLMSDWLKADYSSDSDSSQSARSLAANAIYGHLDGGRKAAAVNEFMAWVLSNQELAKSAAKMSFTSIFKIAGKALEAIGRLVFGRKAAAAGNNILAQLRFSTNILIEMPSTGETLIENSMATMLFQSSAFGTSDRLSEIRQNFHEKITAWFSTSIDKAVNEAIRRSANNLSPVDRANILTSKTSGVSAQAQQAYLNANIVAQGFVQPFNMTPQAASTFKEIVAALAVDVEINPNSLSRIQDIYDHVMSKLSVEDFMTNTGDPMADRSQGQNKLDAMQGLFGTTTDEKGRSSLLPSFMAMAMVDDSFREILSRDEFALPAKLKLTRKETLDQTLINTTTAGMDRLSDVLSGGKVTDTDTTVALDRLAQSLINFKTDTRSLIEQQGDSKIDGIENYVVNAVQDLSEKVVDKSNQVISTTNSRVVKGLARVARLGGTVVNQNQANITAMGVTQWMNQQKNFESFRALLNDIVQRTKENAPLFDMITKVKQAVSQVRQQYRDDVPRIIAEKFGRKLEKAEWTALFRGLGKSDLASLIQAMGVNGALDMLADRIKLTAEIKSLEGSIKSIDARRFTKIQQKAEQLAHYMLTGEHGVRLARNAYAVANLVGEPGSVGQSVNEALIDQVDRLVTLYAVRDLEQSSKDALNILLADTETKAGMAYALSYMSDLRKGETEKNSGIIARVNGYKGTIPSSNAQGVQMLVADDREHARLTLLGYTRVGAYVGSSADRSLGRRSYYFTPVTGRAAFTQGVLQMVHQSVNGVDPDTGFSVADQTAGRITNPDTVRLVNRQLRNQTQTAANLSPVYDADHNVVAFERTIDPAYLGRLNRDTTLSTMMGVWAGRQVEERLAGEYNASLIDSLHKIWTDGQASNRTGEFVDLSKITEKQDPVLFEVWRLIPAHTKDLIKDTFGRDGFQVRRDMAVDAVGYRGASVGDFFTGDTRWSPKVQKTFQDLALGAFGSFGAGNKAYTKLLQAERMTQDLVSNAKMLIVVKSVVVPVGNMISNMFQLLNRGVPFRHIVRGMGKKTDELNQFIRRRHQEIQLEADLKAARGVNDLAKIRQLESRIQTLQDIYKSMSIYPLIAAGEFSSISNGVVTAEDLAIADGKWGDWSEKLAAKIPDGALRTTWRNAFVTKDTALFRGLSQATQYGDFLGKAILYDDLVNRKKLSSKEALVQVNEAFVNYNRLSGRGRQYLESTGMLWFYNFKLRSIKEAGYMMRNHPLRSLMTLGFSPAGNVFTDNLFGLAAESKLGYSMGPAMGFNAFQINPWVNLVK